MSRVQHHGAAAGDARGIRMDGSEISDGRLREVVGGHVFWTNIHHIKDTGAYNATHDENGKLLPRYDAPAPVKSWLDSMVTSVTSLFK